MSPHRTTHLYLVNAQSDKEYRVEMLGNRAPKGQPEECEVSAYFGARGGQLKKHRKGFMLSQEKAQEMFDKLVASKVKEGYTTDVSTLPPSPIPDLSPLGINQAVLLHESDFRRPDLALVISDDETFYSGIGLSCITSEFWIGPMEDARAFAQGVAREYQIMAPTIAHAPDLPPYGAILYWEETEMGLGMVAILAENETLFSEAIHKERERMVPSLEAFPSMKMVGFSGNDNSPFEFVIEYEDEDPVLRKVHFKFLLACTTSEYRSDLKEQMEEEIPGWNKVKAPKA